MDSSTPDNSAPDNTAHTFKFSDGILRIDDVSGIEALTFAPEITAEHLLVQEVGRDLVIGIRKPSDIGEDKTQDLSTLTDKVILVGHVSKRSIKSITLEDQLVKNLFTEGTVTLTLEEQRLRNWFTEGGDEIVIPTSTRWHLGPEDTRHRQRSGFNNGEKLFLEKFNNDGTKSGTVFYRDERHDVLRREVRYNANDQLKFSKTINRDGTRVTERYDVAGARPWLSRVRNFDSSGALTKEVFYNRDQTVTYRNGEGSQTLVGDSDSGPADDIFEFDAGDGADTIGRSEHPGGNDRIEFTGANSDQLLFEQIGLDLKIDTIGTGDSVTVANWFDADNPNEIDVIATADGYELAQKNVQSIVQAMAAFDPLPPGSSKLPDNTQTQAALQLYGPAS